MKLSVFLVFVLLVILIDIHQITGYKSMSDESISYETRHDSDFEEVQDSRNGDDYLPQPPKKRDDYEKSTVTSSTSTSTTTSTIPPTKSTSTKYTSTKSTSTKSTSTKSTAAKTTRSLAVTTTEPYQTTKQTKSSTVDSNDQHPSKVASKQGMYLPAYTVYIFGAAILIMFLILICLIAYLFKSKAKEYKVYTGPVTPSVLSNGHDPSSLVFTEFGIQKTQIQSEFVARPFSQRLRKSNDTELKLFRKTIKKISKGENQISRKEMEIICRNALNSPQQKHRTISRDLNEMIEDKELFGRLENMKEKSASVPMLDLYDTPQKLRVAKKYDNDDPSKNEMEPPIYQSPPSESKVTLVLDNDTQYLLPFSGKSNAEPSYINANRNY